MYQSAVLVHADMCLISKVPCVTLLDLMGIRVSFLLLILGRRWGRNDGGIYDGTLFQNEATLHERCYHLSKQLLLQSVPDQQIPKTAESIPVRNLIAGINTAEFRKCAAVDCLCHCCLVTQVIEVLQQIQSEHDLQRIGFVAALSFVIARLNHGKPFSPRDDPLDLTEKFFFLRPHLRQFIAECGNCHLFIHGFIISHSAVFGTFFCAVLPYILSNHDTYSVT